MDLLIAIITWLAIIEGLSFCVYPFIYTIIGERRIAYGVSKSLGILVFGYLAWVLALCDLMSLDRVSLCILLLSLLCGAHLYIRSQWEEWESVPYPDQKEVLSIEALFFGIFFLMLIIVSFHPEIFWGEKPMDYTFLNFFTRNDVLPPQDPWAAGNKMNYYYVGPMIFGLLHKISGIETNYGYGVSIATIAALLVTSAFSALVTITKSLRWSIWSAVILCFSGTLDALYLLITKKNSFGFDLYWATSRTLHSPGINEYPLWSLLFADLHAHLITLPITLAFLACLLSLITKWPSHNRFVSYIPHALLVGFVWGALAALNTWDYITYGVVAGILFGVLAFSPFSETGIKARFHLCLIALLTLLSSVLFSLPFHISVSSNARIGWGYVTNEEFNSIWEILRIHGHWIAVIILSPLVLRKFISESSRSWTLPRIGFFLFFSLLPLGLGLLHQFYLNIPGAPWGILSMASLVCLTSMLLIRSSRSETLTTLGLLSLSSGILYSIAELYYLMDRMNTTFKVYHPLWLLTGISALSLLFVTTQQSEEQRIWKNPLVWILSPVFISAIAGSVICISTMVTFARIPGHRPTLDGTAYLNQYAPDEKKAFDWINVMFRGTPVLLEAWGPSYQDYTRFSMNTGLPTVLGWDPHVLQRGTDQADFSMRKHDILTIYTTVDTKNTLKLLNKYHVDLIIIGKQERRQYNGPGLRKFDLLPEIFPLLFTTGEGENEIKIYTTTYSSLAP